MSNQTLLYQSDSGLLFCVAHWSFTYFYQRTWDAEAQRRHRHKVTLVHPIVIGHVRGGCSIAAMASEDFLSKTTYTIEASRGQLSWPIFTRIEYQSFMFRNKPCLLMHQSWHSELWSREAVGTWKFQRTTSLGAHQSTCLLPSQLASSHCC